MLKIILHLLGSVFRSRQSIALENLALRHQLYVLRRPRSRIRLKKRNLVRRMTLENPLWGALRIHGEMLKLGLNVAQATVSRYMRRGRKPPSQTWRTFLKNHETVSLARGARKPPPQTASSPTLWSKAR